MDVPTYEELADTPVPAERVEDDELLRPADVCRLFKISRSTLWRWGSEGLLTPVRISSKTTRYRRSEIASLMTEAAR